MIGKIKISKTPTFTPICDYVGGEEKEAEVLAAHGVRGTSAAHMAADFDEQRALRPDLGRAVMHVALAWPAEEKAMSNELMLELTLAWMKKMGIDAENTQWSLTRHHGTDHPHGHLIINRVANDGATISDQKNYGKSVEACRALEKEYGLVNAKEAGQDTRRAEPEKLKAREVPKLYVQDSESRHKPLAATPEEMLAAMKRDGIKSEATYGPDGKLRTVVYEYQGHHFKGSELGRECSGGNVAKTIDAQRESVLAQREAVSAAVQQVGQSGTGLKAFFAAFGAQANAAEKAERDTLAQQQAQKEATKKADRTVLAQKQADEKVERDALAQKQAEKDAKLAALDPRLRPGYVKPTIQKDEGLSI
jgi:hypothetical protein